MRTNLNNIKGHKVLIVGFGKSGIALAQTMLELGAEVFVQDSRKESEFDKALLSFFKEKGVGFYCDTIPPDMGDFDMIILSPGVSPELPFIQEGQSKGAEITGELEIAFRASKGTFIAITGTNGKTTTTTLVGEIFKASGRKTNVVGNIGTVAVTAAVEATEEDWLVTEASSFQLETTKYFKPVVSAILNLTPDHLNRHHTMEEYGKAKAKIFANQDANGFLVINYDDKVCYALAKNAKAKVVPFSRKEELDFGAFLKGDTIVIKDVNSEIEICKKDEIKILGDHNIENVLAAAAICYFAGIDADVISRTVTEFAGVEHRIEYCGTVDGVRYYNDSKGTNTDASIIAIRALKDNIILIAGGDGKGQSFDELAKELAGSVKTLILLGRDGPVIGETAERYGFTSIKYCKDMQDCVNTAASIAVPEDKVLLSPACASWDMYDNFEQRGEHFKSCVEMLNR